MLRFVLIRPGSTDFDDQRRIKGTLNIPLNENGSHQVARAADELENAAIERIYCAPCRSAEETARQLSDDWKVKVKRLESLANLDHGLWQGKLIEEVKKKQPKVYRQWQDRPETICPPGGETLADAQQRVRKELKRLFRKHKKGVVALVVPDPLASMIRSILQKSEIGDIWKSECDFGEWELIDIETPSKVLV